MHFSPHRPFLASVLAFAIAVSAASISIRAESIAPHPLPTETCGLLAGGKVFARTQLYFGLARPAGEVSEAEFQRFIATQVTPRFPEGLTLLTGKGQFLDARGAVTEEGSKLLILFYVQDEERNQAIEAIRREYKTAFSQQSVLRVDEHTCASF